MFYYRHDANYVLVEKSTTPLEGDNVVTHLEDFNLELYTVTVGYILNGAAEKITKKVKDAEALDRKLKAIEERQTEAEIDIDFRLSIIELGLV